jgi:hypothetical protein
MPIFGKSIEEITAADVEGLGGTPEGQTFELKSELSSAKGRKQPDPWMMPSATGRDRRGPEDHAKEGLFRELVAFANAEGGWLVLGMGESADHPKRATAPAPLPDCHELAQRLQRAADDWVDPPMPGIRFCGIAIGDSGAGVVVARAPRSPLAPHRLSKSGRTKEAYRRVGDESKPMGMREIQEMTLQRRSEGARMEAMFEEGRAAFVRIPVPQGFVRMVGFHIIGVPVNGPLAAERLYRHPELFDRVKSGFAPLASGRKMTFAAFDACYDHPQIHFRPVLRGAQRIDTYRINQPGKEPVVDIVGLELRENGLLSLGMLTSEAELGISMQWILVEVTNALRSILGLRKLASAHDAEYALEIVLRWDEHQPRGVLRPIDSTFNLGLLNQEVHFTGKVEASPTILPRHSVRDEASFPAIFQDITRDLHNLAGRVAEE